MERKCVGCEIAECSASMECLKCGLKFCFYCGLVRNLCDDCYTCYGELFNIKKLKANKKIKISKNGIV